MSGTFTDFIVERIQLNLLLNAQQDMNAEPKSGSMLSCSSWKKIVRNNLLSLLIKKIPYNFLRNCITGRSNRSDEFSSPYKTECLVSSSLILSGSGCFHHQAKIVRKTFIHTVFWFLYEFPNLSQVRIHGSGSISVPKCHGSATLIFSNSDMLVFSYKTGSETKQKVIFTCPACGHLCYCTLSHPAPLFSSPNESARHEYYFPRKFAIKDHCHEIDIFFWRFRHFNQYFLSVCDDGFQVLSKAFHFPTVHNY